MTKKDDPSTTTSKNANGREARAWLVDLDGTLYYSLPLKLAMAAELASAGLRTVNVLRAFRQEHERMRRERLMVVGQNTSPFEVQLERTAARVDRPIEEVEQLVREWMIERPAKWLRRVRRRGLMAEITAFRAGGGSVALVSDYPARVKLDGLGVSELFDVVVANGEPGGPSTLKPDPAGYLLAAERLGFGVSQCLVIGDRLDADGEAARAAGMTFRHVGK